jgi:hypothetical protein
MSKITIYLGSIFVIANTIIGLLFTNYLIFKWLIVDATLIFNTILVLLLLSKEISNGYKIGLSFIYPLMCLLSILLILLSPLKFKDNYFVLGFIFIVVFEVSLYLISKKINTNN